MVRSDSIDLRPSRCPILVKLTGAFLVAAFLLAGCGTPSDTADSGGIPQSDDSSGEASAELTPQAIPPSDPGAREGDNAKGSAALKALRSLPVKGRAPQTGYSRGQFGQTWADVNRNGCDTRTDILNESLSPITRSGRCTVLSGVLADPYTGTQIRYQRGGVSEVDIDHVVALSNAWQTGAFGFPFAKRVAFANDPLNLLAVDASANRQKGDGDAATWLPPNKSYRCAYVARQVAVKQKYELWVTPAERNAIAAILGSCGKVRLPAPGAQPTIASNTGSVPRPVSSAASSESATSGGARALYYANCAAAAADG